MNTPPSGSKIKEIVIKKNRNRNLVQLDGILKELEEKEFITKDISAKKWSYLLDYYKEYYENENSKRKVLKKAPASKKNIDKLVTIKPSPPSPITSSQVIGWRSSILENNLEIFGKMYISPKRTIHPPDDQPQKQYTIFLG